MGMCKCQKQNEEVDLNYTSKQVNKKDFHIEKTLGKGAFGKVLMVRKKDTHQVYAMKILQKQQVVQQENREQVENERKILQNNKCPFLVSLVYAFQTANKLYLVMEFCPGGELFYHLRKAGKFDEAKTKFYSAELILALEYLHENGIIYRDLKPENCLLDEIGHIKLTDFGLSKQGMMQDQHTYTFCGSYDYIAPEIIQYSGYSKAVD